MSDLIQRLRLSAESEAAAHRMVTDARHGPAYASTKVEQTAAWKAADRIEALEAEVARLREERDAARAHQESAHRIGPRLIRVIVVAGRFREERNEARADNARLREALKPFAATADRMGSGLSDDYELPTTSLTMRDLRRAQSAVSEKRSDA